MHFKIVLFIIVSIHFSLRFTQRLESSRKIFKSEIINPQNTDLNDTPSPEWIKYQQERFEHNTKAQIFQDKEKEIKINHQNKTHYNPSKHKSEIILESSDKIETTSRQSQDNNEQKQQAKFETMTLNSQHSENTTETNDSTPNSTDGIQFPSIQGFIEFLKSLKQTWMKNSIFRIDDKIKMLHNLKDTLMKTIEQQFMVLWQDDDDDGEDDPESGVDHNSENIPNKQYHLRRKRGILDESNINFPPDAALMSINFLTFAVFLIKLVLQVVHIIKSKHYQLSTLNMTDTGAIRYRG